MNNFLQTQYFHTPANFQLAQRSLQYAGMGNAIKTINGLSKIVDSFHISLFPDLVEQLISSQSLMRHIASQKIYSSYQKEPTITINENKISEEVLKDLQQQAKNKISQPFSLKHPLGYFTPFNAVIESLSLAERHGGSLLLMCYDGEQLEDYEKPFDEKIKISTDSKTKLIFYPISLARGNIGNIREMFGDKFTDKIKKLNDNFLKNPKDHYNTDFYSIASEKTIPIQFTLGNSFKVHTSRLIPVRSMIKSYSAQQYTQGWDNSIFQGSLKAFINYYLCIDALPQMMDEKVLNTANFPVSLAELESEKKREQLNDAIMQMAENATNSSFVALTNGVEIQRHTLDLSDIPAIITMLVQTICANTETSFLDLTGQGASGFSNGNDVMRNAFDKTFKVHSKYDWVWETVLSKWIVNTAGIKNLQEDDVKISFNTKPTPNAEEQVKVDTQSLVLATQWYQGGAISNAELREIINKVNIQGIQLPEDNLF